MTDEEKTIDELRRKYAIALDALKKYRGAEATEIVIEEITSSSGIRTGFTQKVQKKLGKVANVALARLGE